MAANYPSLSIMGAAATFRAMAGSSAFPLMVAELARARRSRYCNISPYLRWWTRGGILGHMARVKEHVEYIACSPPIENYGIQRWATKHLQDNIPMSKVDDCLALRLSTLLKKEVPVATAATVRARLLAAKAFVPQCAIASMLRTVCNAWTTTGRFSGPTAPCPFGCGAPEGDRFLHFPGCTSLREMWGSVCPGAPLFINISAQFVTLTATTMSNDEVVQAVIWADVVGQCCNDARASVPPRMVCGEAGRNMLIARLRSLGVQCDYTRFLIRNMRSEFLDL
jgi:hypothetical protein